MMRGFEWRRTAARPAAGECMNDSNITLRFFAQVGKDSGESLGQERLSDARGSHHGEVVPASCSNLKTVAGKVMAAHVGEVRVFWTHGWQCTRALSWRSAPQDFHHLRKRGRAADPRVCANLAQARCGHDDPIVPPSRQDPGQRAAHGAEMTIQTQLSDEDGAREVHMLQLLRRLENGDGDRQVKAGAQFANLGGRQTHRDALSGPRCTDACER
jgi:hypothetical protein